MKAYLPVSMTAVAKRLTRGLSVTVSPTELKVAADVSLQDLMRRHAIRGKDPEDKRPFYFMDEKWLVNRYFRHAADWEWHRHRLLYAETLALRPTGLNGIQSNAWPVEDIKLLVEPTPWRLGYRLAAHRDIMVNLFKDTGRIIWRADLGDFENDETVSVSQIRRTDNVIVLKEARYLDQVATNLTLDTDSGGFNVPGDTIRSTVEAPIDGALWPLADSSLANTLGVAAMVISRDGEWLWRLRNPGMGSIATRGLHCPASGVYIRPKHLRRGTEGTFQDLVHGMEEELRSELGLIPEEYDLHPVALTRELPRGGKPQLFFVCISSLSIEEIGAKAKLATERSEFVLNSVHEFLLQSEQLVDPERYTYEGWACAYFTAEFLEANPDLICSTPT